MCTNSRLMSVRATVPTYMMYLICLHSDMQTEHDLLKRGTTVLIRSSEEWLTKKMQVSKTECPQLHLKNVTKISGNVGMIHW